MKRAISLVILFVCAAGIVALIAQAQAPRKHPSPVAAQTEDYLEIGSAKVQLGMTKAQVAEALKGYLIAPADADNWTLDLARDVTWTPEQGFSETQIVTLQFTAGRLNVATREWPIHENDVTGTIFGLISHWEQERRVQNRLPLLNCNVGADIQARPDTTAQRVWIECGQKAAVIAKLTPSVFGKNTGIMEVLGERRP